MEIRPIAPADLPVAAQVFLTSLGEELGDVSRGAWLGYLEHSTNVGAWLGDRLVGTATQYAAELTMPGGGMCPVHAVTGVGVLPTHTRRGAARGMMQWQLDTATKAGVGALVLEASEATIYGKFGYGPATVHRNVALQAAHVRLAQDLPDDGSFEYAEGEALAQHAQIVFERWRPTSPGQLSRPPHLWGMTLVDPPEWRGGATSLYWVFHVDANGTPDGYVSYRLQNRWENSLSAAEAKVVDLVAADPRVRGLLVQWVARVDLVEYVSINGLPADDPLEHLLVDPRRLRVPDHRDGLWVRIVDVPRAMAARAWWAQDDLAIEVVDPDSPAVAGTWQFTVRDGRAEVVRTDAAPDLTMSVADLGMLWLGGVTARSLAGAGRVVGAPEAVDRATVLFRGLTAPNHIGEF